MFKKDIMAASASPLERGEDFQDFLTCSICTEPYDNGEHQAKCLPCLHTYCKSCLQQHAGKQTKFNCPNCHMDRAFPGGTIESLPNNFIVENLKEYQDIFNSEVPCGCCDEKNQAVNFCHDCGCFLCQDCEDAHKKLGPLRKHKRTTMSDLREKKYNPLMQQHCVKHPNQDLSMYCRGTDCKVPICATCSLVNHQGHDLIKLAVVNDKIITHIKQSSSRLNSRKRELECKQAAIENALKTLTDNYRQKTQGLWEMVREFHSQIDSCRNKASSSISTLYRREKCHLTAGAKSICLLTAQMTSACEFANRACDMSHPTQLMTSYNQIMDRLRELENTELPETTSDKTDLVFTDTYHSAMSQINESLHCLRDADLLAKFQGQKDGKQNLKDDVNEGEMTPKRR